MVQLLSERAVARAVRAAYGNLGEDVRRLREDAGVSRAELARASGVDPSFLARIELGTAHPSLETCARLGVSLGADLATRLYPTTGPLVRDRHQLAIAESLLPILHATWHPFLEVAVRRPSRGWIDLALHNRSRAVIAAVEIQSELRGVEQVIRWSEEKARSLPSWERMGPARRRTVDLAAAHRSIDAHDQNDRSRVRTGAAHGLPGPSRGCAGLPRRRRSLAGTDDAVGGRGGRRARAVPNRCPAMTCGGQ